MFDQLKARLLDGLGLEVRRTGTLAHFLASRPIDLVVDAGANLGQFAQSIRRKGYKGRIHSFEPVSYIFDALQQTASNDPLWQVTKAALGAEPGNARINVHKNHTLSSFLQGSELLKSFNTTEGVEQETVPVRRLDDVLERDPGKDIFLKLDVQGFEKQVLEGAEAALDRVVAMLVELPVRSLYENSWSLNEALNYMDGLGFEPAQCRMVNPLPDDPASAVEFDVLFRRKAG